MRKDGVRLKNIDPMYSIVPHIMDKRSDSQNYITIDIPVEPMDKYIRAKRQEGIKISHLSLISAAYVRTCAEYQQLNRFIVNRKVFARKELTVGMVVLKAGTLEKETMSKLYFDVEDDINDVQRKMDEYIEKNREEESNNKTDKIIRTLCSMTFLMRFGVSSLKWMDRHGLLPKSIIDASPFHCSIVLTNLGSLRTNHIYHHIYDFGTVSQILAIGNLREVPKRSADGVEFVRCMPIGVVMDERICSGAYYATAFKRFAEYLADPKKLEGEPKVINRDF
ncbi:MAG: 2-oxo acid dehydrogenase subunit E2 [Clostridia bacterium]|nr:2-oxo acid dehydrogenase subunit E2 [Clostridia bacterium]